MRIPINVTLRTLPDRTGDTSPIWLTPPVEKAGKTTSEGVAWTNGEVIVGAIMADKDIDTLRCFRLSNAISIAQSEHGDGLCKFDADDLAMVTASIEKAAKRNPDERGALHHLLTGQTLQILDELEAKVKEDEHAAKPEAD